MECPICKGSGSLGVEAMKLTETELKKKCAKTLRDKGFSIRQIMKLMGYKSPRSIQTLLQ